MGVKWDDWDLDEIIGGLQSDREEISRKIADSINTGNLLRRKSLRLPKLKTTKRSKSVLNEDFNFVNQRSKQQLQGGNARSPTSLNSSVHGSYKDRILDLYMKDEKNNILTKLNDSERGVKDLIW